MWSGKLMERYGIKGYHILLKSDRKILADDTDKTKQKGVSTLKLINFTA